MFCVHFLISSYHNLVICFMGKEAEAEGQLTGIMSHSFENTCAPNTGLYHLITKVFKSIYLEFYNHLIPGIFYLLITHSLHIIPYSQSIIMEAIGNGEDSSWT